MQVTLSINGKPYTRLIEPDMTLYSFVRDCGCYSVKCGCETTNCGLCTVWMDGVPVLSCSVLAVRAEGHEITTLEGVLEEAKVFTDFLTAEGAEQCGFCSPGFIMNVLAMKRELDHPTEDEIRRYLSGNLCRCTGYMGQMRAIRNYMEVEA